VNEQLLPLFFFWLFLKWWTMVLRAIVNEYLFRKNIY
jgi:hypothetical protein